MQGNFITEKFRYVQISIIGCDQDELLENEECNDVSEVDNLHVNFVGL